MDEITNDRSHYQWGLPADDDPCHEITGIISPVIVNRVRCRTAKGFDFGVQRGAVVSSPIKLGPNTDGPVTHLESRPAEDPAMSIRNLPRTTCYIPAT
jgi:hypothetical protein